MKVHELKTWPAPFAAVYDGAKRHEIRKADRDYAVGDLLHLREWAPATHAYDLNGPRPGAYTGRELRALVTYLTRGGEWGIPDGMCVMSIEPIEVSEQEWRSLTDELAAMERTDPAVAEAARRYDQMRGRLTADLPDVYLFGPRGAVGRNDYGPGHYLWDRHGERVSVRHPMWRVDGTLAPCRDLRTGTIVWGQPAWTCTECQQGEFLIHHGINGSTVMAWWDRTQGDARPGSNVVLVVEGRHDATAMLSVLRFLYPTALANLERAGVTLREVKP